MDGAEGTSEKAAFAPTEVTDTATDDDVPGVRSWATAPGVPESGSGISGVQLNTQPSGAVTVRLARAALTRVTGVIVKWSRTGSESPPCSGWSCWAGCGADTMAVGKDT